MENNIKQWYIFTFGYGNEHQGRYKKYFGTYEEARKQMIADYGLSWGFQYSESEWEQWCARCHEEGIEYMLETELNEIEVVLDNGAYTPVRAYEFDAGLDLMTPDAFIIKGKSSYVIDTGVHVTIPKGYVGMLKSKSGLNVKNNLVGEGVIDCGYTGAIKVKLYNNGDSDVFIPRGSKISQLVIIPIITPAVKVVDKLKETERGDNGFGSTGM